MHIVIVGAGAAGTSALDTIRAYDQKAKVTVVSESEPYSPFALAEFITGSVDKSSLQRFPKRFFEDRNARFINKKVKKLDARNRRIILDDGKMLGYNRLLLAHGSSPIRPRIPGMDRNGVFCLFTLREAEVIKRWLVNNKVKRVVVIGAGFTGLEAVVSLRKKGIEVAIVEMLENVLPKMLEPDVARKVEKSLRSKGVKLHLSETVQEIEGDERVATVKTNKRRLKAESVIVTMGVRPNLSILKGSRIKTKTGIIVDETMRTSIDDVYAAGDVTEFKDAMLGLRMVNAIWPNAVRQGQTAACNMLGISRRFEDSDIINIIDIFGTPVVAMGYMKSELKDCEEIKVKGRDHIKVLVHDDRILGFQGIGDTAVRFGGLIQSMMKRKMDIGSLKPDLKNGKFKNLYAELRRLEESSSRSSAL